MQIKNPVVGLVRKAQIGGVATSRFRISKEQAAQLREAEKQSHDAAIRTLLGFLRTPQAK